MLLQAIVSTNSGLHSDPAIATVRHVFLKGPFSCRALVLMASDCRHQRGIEIIHVLGIL